MFIDQPFFEYKKYSYSISEFKKYQFNLKSKSIHEEIAKMNSVRQVFYGCCFETFTIQKLNLMSVAIG